MHSFKLKDISINDILVCHLCNKKLDHRISNTYMHNICSLILSGCGNINYSFNKKTKHISIIVLNIHDINCNYSIAINYAENYMSIFGNDRHMKISAKNFLVEEFLNKELFLNKIRMFTKYA